MKIALIDKSLCVNTVEFESIKEAIDLLGLYYEYIIECPEERGIGHRYINKIWRNPLPEKINGEYEYIKDMDVLVGDIVFEYNNGIKTKYIALEDITCQQNKPSELPDKYKEVSI